MKPPLRIVVGYYNYADLRALEEGVTAHNQRVAAAEEGNGREFKIVEASQDAQKVFDGAVSLDADVALICPEIRGYRTTLIRDLLYNEKRPVPVIGWVPPHTDDGRAMEANGAKGFILLPMDERSAARFLTLAEEAVENALRERAEGRIHIGAGAAPGNRQNAWQQKMITIYVPKGGGSTRTTLATNLAVGLSHISLGNQPTALVDLDMAKGDCHTLLGYTVDTEVALRKNWPLIDRGLFDLVLNVAAQWPTQAENSVTPVLIRQFLAHWGGAESQLDLLPGLTNPHQGAAREFTHWEMLYRTARKLLQEIRRMYAFVVADIGQDYNLPLHRAAIEEADEVLVTVPPTRTALVDTVHALPPLKATFGNLNKFKLVITAYDPNFGITEKEIVDAVGLPKLATIPHDARTAHMAVNNAMPFVLTDREGPLGEAIRSLVEIYLPYVGQENHSRKLFGGFNLKGLFVREN